MPRRIKETYFQIRPYIRIMRLNQQGTVLVAFFFGALDAGLKNFYILLPIALALFLISVASFIINEYVDARDTDKYSARTRAIANIHIVGKAVFVLWFIVGTAGTVLMFRFGLYWQALVAMTIGTFYSLPPFRFKAKFPLDQLAVLTYLVVIPYSISYSINKLSFDKMVNIPLLSLVLFLGVAQGIHLLSDLEADKKARLSNTPVILGYYNLLKLLIVMAFGSFLGFTYLIYSHTYFWYYPLIFFAALALLALGYARGNIHNPNKLVARFSWATNIAVSLGNYLFIYQIIVIYYLMSRR